MDNKAQEFARQIISRLEDLKRLIHDAVLVPRNIHPGPGNDKTDTNNGKKDADDSVQIVLAGGPFVPPKGQNAAPQKKYTACWKWLKQHGVELLGVLVLGVYTFFTKCTLDQVVVSNALTRQSVQISNRAYVTLGRKDGVVADFVVPKDPKQNAEIIIYFQNSGHIPAKFAWGASVAYKAAGNTKQSGITMNHQFNGFSRTRDIKSGSVSEGGESVTIAGDTVFVSTLGTISQKDLADMPTSVAGLLIIGMFQYCDELGTSTTRIFDLRYRSNAPASNLSFEAIGDTDFKPPLPKGTDSTEYLPPCETISEREQNQKKK